MAREGNHNQISGNGNTLLVEPKLLEGYQKYNKILCFSQVKIS